MDTPSYNSLKHLDSAMDRSRLQTIMKSSPLPTLMSTKTKHSGGAMDGSDFLAAGTSPLVTTLRRMQPRDVEATIKAFPRPSSTIPAVRPRAHRGGESLLLKDTYPSGFCLSVHNTVHKKHHLNDRDGSNISLRRRISSPLEPDDDYCLLSGKKKSGVIPCGKLIGKRVITITQLVVGDRAVQDTTGSELVQFGPDFPCEQPDQLPHLRHVSNRGRVISASAMTLPSTILDGSALEKKNIDVAPSADEDNRQPCNSIIRPIVQEPSAPKHMNNRSAGAAKNPARVTRALKQRPGGLNGGLSRASHPQVMSLEASPMEPVTAEVRAFKVSPTYVVNGEREINTSEGSEDERRSEVARHPSARGEQGSEDLCKQPERIHPGGDGGETSRGATGAEAENKRDDRSGPRAMELARVYKENGRIGSEWAAFTSDSLAVCQEGSVYSLESLIRSSVSPSTLDTEQYGGNISEDATAIMRSYLEWPRKEPGDVCTNFPQADAEAFLAPIPPLGIPSKPPSGCYLRTCQDVILAVIRKGDLLECDDDVGLQRLKAAAVPVRVTVDMTLKEGIGAIVSSGMLEQDCVDNDEDDGGYQAGASEEHSGVGRVRGMSRAWELEYFNSRTGTWDAVRNETDWKILLMAPTGRHGAGVNFQCFGGNYREVDFLVAVSPSPLASRSPEIWRRKTEIASVSAKGERFGCCHPAQVTAGALASQEARRQQNVSAEHFRKDTEQSSDVACSIWTALGTEELEKESSTEIGKRLAGLTGYTVRRGPWPGTALWTSGTNSSGNYPDFIPRKDNLRSLAKCLEARLKLKGRVRSGGSPADTTKKIELPYASELAKWGYDEILGIPRTGPVEI